MSDTSMGTKAAPSYANTIMGKFNDFLYTYHTQPLPWKRSFLHPTLTNARRVYPTLHPICQGETYLQYTLKLDKHMKNMILHLQDRWMMDRQSLLHTTHLGPKNTEHSILVMTYNPENNSLKQIMTNNNYWSLLRKTIPLYLSSTKN